MKRSLQILRDQGSWVNAEYLIKPKENLLFCVPLTTQGLRIVKDAFVPATISAGEHRIFNLTRIAHFYEATQGLVRQISFTHIASLCLTRIGLMPLV